MAQAPTTDEVIRMIYEYVRQNGWDPRPGTVAFGVSHLQIDLLRKGVRGDELTLALQKLSDDGEFEQGSTRWKITEKGYAKL